MEEKKYYLYHKISPLGLNYLGITTQNPHKYRGSGTYWKNHLKAHEITTKNIVTIILFETINKNELVKMGNYYSTLYDVVKSELWANLEPENCEHTIHSEETKNKISKAKKGRKYSYEHNKNMGITKIGNKYCLGRKHTEESKRKMKEAQGGEKHPLFGKKHKKNSIKKMSLAKTGRSNPAYNSTPVIQYDLQGNFIKEWHDMIELKENGFNVGKISRVCRWKEEKSQGYKWKFKSVFIHFES